METINASYLQNTEKTFNESLATMNKKETETHNFEKQQGHWAAALRSLWNYSGYVIYPNKLFKDQIEYRFLFFLKNKYKNW